jgi:hypothetical protein
LPAPSALSIASIGRSCYHPLANPDSVEEAIVSDQPAVPADTQPIHPDIDWQASLLAAKVLRRVMTLAQECDELAAWQADAGGKSGEWRAVEPRALIITHMMNSLLSRGY